MKKCMYCSSEIAESSVLDVCNLCGVKVWGEKMFSTIVENMEGARDSGDLFQGNVSSQNPAQTQPNPENRSQNFTQ